MAKRLGYGPDGLPVVRLHYRGYDGTRQFYQIIEGWAYCRETNKVLSMLEVTKEKPGKRPSMLRKTPITEELLRSSTRKQLRDIGKEHGISTSGLLKPALLKKLKDELL